MILTSQALWIRTRTYVREQLPGANDETVTDVTTKVYEQMKFLVGQTPADGEGKHD